MTYALAVISVLSLVNIVLTLAVIRRLGRSQAQRPGGAGPAPGWPAVMTVEPGSEIGDFAVTSSDGEPVSRDLLTGDVLVAFLAPGCQACDASLPAFIARAEAAPGGRDQVLAVVMGDGAAAGEVRERLAPVARILTETEEDGPLARAFGVGGLPAFALLSGSTVVASHALAERLPHAAASA